MANIQCKMCGGELSLADGIASGTCQYCGSLVTFPKITDAQYENLYNRAEHYRRINDYDKAVSTYQELIAVNGDDSEAHWGLVLSRYGIEYVEDPATHERVPTCHRVCAESILADPDYLTALETAGFAEKEIYEAEAKRIFDIQQGILAISNQEDPFDIFICYKETDENGKRTKDAVIAQDIYYELTENGYRVFFSKITLESRIGQQYEPYIFAALNSAKVMLVIGSKAEYFNAPWVKNEWSRFISLMKKDRKKLLIPCFRDINIYDLPEELTFYQSEDISKIGFMHDILEGVKKVIKKDENVSKNTVSSFAGSGMGNPMLRRAKLFNESNNFAAAIEYCEKVLDSEPENGYAYYYRLLGELKMNNENMLFQYMSLAGHPTFRLAKKFADDELAAKLDNIITVQNKSITELNERRIAEEIQQRKAIAEQQQKIKEQRIQQQNELNRIGKAKNLSQKRIAVLQQHLNAERYLQNNAMADKIAQCISFERINIILNPAPSQEIIDKQVQETQYIMQALGNLDAKLCKVKEKRSLVLKKYKRILAFSGIIAAAVLVVIISIAIKAHVELSSRIDKAHTAGLNVDSETGTVCVGYISDNDMEYIIPDSITQLDSYFMSNHSKVKKVTIPKTIENIPYEAFKNCTALETVVLHDGVKTIDASAFSGCRNLKNINFPDTITDINKDLFSDVNNICITVSYDFYKLHKDKLNYYNLHVIVPDKIVNLPGKAFFNSKNIVKITLSKKLTAIGDEAFAGCRNLKEIELPSTLYALGKNALGNIRKIKIDKNNKNFRFKENGEIVYIPGKLLLRSGKDSGPAKMYRLPIGIINVDKDAFCAYDFVQLYYDRSFKLPDIPYHLVLSDDITSIKDEEFANDRNLRGITLPETLTTIGKKAFYKTRIKEIIIPDSVLEIGDSVFEGSIVDSVSVSAALKYGKNTFYGIKVIKRLTSEQKSGVNVCKLSKDGLTVVGVIAPDIKRCIVPAGVKHIANDAFFGCAELKEVVLPDGLETIGVCSFSECYELTSVNFPLSLRSIGFDAFGACKKLTNVSLYHHIKTKVSFPPSCKITYLKTPDQQAGRGLCIIKNDTVTGVLFKDITHCEIPNGVKTIGQGAFADCKNLSSVKFPESVSVIERDAFKNCAALKDVFLHDNVSEIGVNAFLNCDPQISISVGNNTKIYDRSAKYNVRGTPVFAAVENKSASAADGNETAADEHKDEIIANRTTKAKQNKSHFVLSRDRKKLLRLMPSARNLTELRVPDTVTSIEYRALANCIAKKIILPPNLKTISDYAFYGCKNLESIVFPETLTYIGEAAFFGSGLKNVSIPSSVMEICRYAFFNCRYLTDVRIPKYVSFQENTFPKGCRITRY